MESDNRAQFSLIHVLMLHHWPMCDRSTRFIPVARQIYSCCTVCPGVLCPVYMQIPWMMVFPSIPSGDYSMSWYIVRLMHFFFFLTDSSPWGLLPFSFCFSLCLSQNLFLSLWLFLDILSSMFAIAGKRSLWELISYNNRVDMYFLCLWWNT